MYSKHEPDVHFWIADYLLIQGQRHNLKKISVSANEMFVFGKNWPITGQGFDIMFNFGLK